MNLSKKLDFEENQYNLTTFCFLSLNFELWENTHFYICVEQSLNDFLLC